MSTRECLTSVSLARLFQSVVHELSISEAVVSGVCEQLAPTLGESRITRVVLEVGRLSAVEPDALRFCFELSAAGTPVAGAALDIIEIPVTADCLQCGVRFESNETLTCICNACGSLAVDIINGRELRVKLVELD